MNAVVLRHGHHWPSNKTRWTATHYNWLEGLKFAHDWQQVVLQEYIDAVKAAQTRTGNSHARRTLVESAWSYRFPARQTAHLKRKAAAASDEARPSPASYPVSSGISSAKRWRK